MADRRGLQGTDRRWSSARGGTERRRERLGRSPHPDSCEQMTARCRVFVSLTAPMHSLPFVGVVMANLLSQTRKPDRIFLAVPRPRNGSANFVWNAQHLPREVEPIFTDDDFGPSMKFALALLKLTREDPSAVLVVVDDDTLYPQTLVQDLLDGLAAGAGASACRGWNFLPASEPRGVREAESSDMWSGWDKKATLPIDVDVIAGESGYALRVSDFVQPEVRNKLLPSVVGQQERRYADDVYLSGLLHRHGVSRHVVRCKESFDMRFPHQSVPPAHGRLSPGNGSKVRMDAKARALHWRHHVHDRVWEQTANLRSTSVSINGLQLQVFTHAPETDLISRYIADKQMLFCEPSVMDAARALHRKHQGPLRCLDIGANLGSCGLWWLAEGLCYSVLFYEANRVTADLLRRTLRANRHLYNGSAAVRNVAAVSVTDETRILHVPEGNSGHSTLDKLGTDSAKDPWLRSNRSLRVRTLRIDEDPEAEGAQLAKLDVEGHECETLRGMPRLLASSLELVVAEADPGLLETAGCSVRSLRTGLFEANGWHVTGRSGASSNIVARRGGEVDG